MVIATQIITPTFAKRIGVSGNGVVAAIAAGVLGIIVLLAIIPGFFTPIDPIAANTSAVLLAPSAEHWFGTDQLGRDVFARVVHGARSSILLGVGATLVALTGGVLIGVTAGLSRGWVDRILSRALDILFAFPDLLIAILLVAVLGPGLGTLVVAIGVGAIGGYARVLRSQVQVVRNAGYVESAIGLGHPTPLVVLKHVLPNSIGPLLVLATIGVGVAIISGAALSFVGLGAAPPTPEWGLMLAESRDYLSRAPWLGVWPGVFLALTVVSINVIGRYAQRRFLSGTASA